MKTSLKMATIGGRNIEQATLFIIQEIYVSVYSLLDRVFHKGVFFFPNGERGPRPTSTYLGKTVHVVT
jgi:hypothetical protein